MKNHKLYKGVWVAPNTKSFELLESKEQEDQKKAKRLHEFCHKASACFYEYKAIAALRAEYSDVV